MEKAKELRKKYPEFIYQDYAYRFKSSELQLWFYFLIKPDLRFKTEIIIKNVFPRRFQTINKPDIENLIFHLGLAEMLNYWKLTCSPNINIKAGNLDKKQKTFLRKLIINGMGQYFYQNKIDFTKRDFLQIESAKYIKKLQKSSTVLDKNKTLVPVGGGKDAAVVLEILKNKNHDLGAFVLNTQKAQKEIIKIAGIKEKIFVQREIDPLLFKLNKQGYLNGHVPFSAFLTHLSFIIALLFDYKNIAFAWEKSADEPNVRYKNKLINHQWSKSSKWEKQIQDYVKDYLLENMKIYSPIRKLSELEIAQEFAQLKKYHKAFLSCNNAYKRRVKDPNWCGKCAKCLFVFTSLYPFMEEKELIKIFNKNLFQNKSLIPLMKELVGKSKHKPFECVGTIKENNKAFKLSLKKFQDVHPEKKLPPVLMNFTTYN
jgi:UDP-N-acetyl-alpha-D-muramoyl-L-alanyl-L-glutamate epimerase